MLKFVKLNDSEKNTDFAKILFESAFPPEERPTFENMRSRPDEEFQFNVIEDDGKPVGILSFWDFGEFAYIEHFAIDEALRNNGLGSKTLKTLKESVFPEKEMILEVEPPENETAKHRIAFYERNGFFCNTGFEYTQPPYGKGMEPVPMLVMSRNRLAATQLRKFTETLYQKVYHTHAV